MTTLQELANNYGPWIALVVFLLFNFRKEIFDLVLTTYQDFAKDRHDRREASQHMDEVGYEFEVQKEILDRARRDKADTHKYETDRIAFTLISNQFELYQKDFKDMNRTISEMLVSIARIQRELEGIRTSLRECWVVVGEINKKINGRD